jgi:predicted amidophosphoribosyltransferase
MGFVKRSEAVIDRVYASRDEMLRSVVARFCPECGREMGEEAESCGECAEREGKGSDGV